MNQNNDEEDIPIAEPCMELKEAWSIFFGNDNLCDDETLFLEKLLSHLPALDKERLEFAWKRCNKESEDIQDNHDTSSVAIDCLHPAFSFLIVATETEGHWGVDNYKRTTNHYAVSSIAFRYESGGDRPCAQTTKIATCPFVAATLVGESDPFAMLDIDNGDVYGVYRNQCAIATTATALVVSLCVKKEHYRDVALPFGVARGTKCTLYFTTLNDDGVPRIYIVGYPDGSNGKDNELHPSPSITRKKFFVAMAVLLNKFHALFQIHGRQRYRKLLCKQIQPNNPLPTINDQGRTSSKMYEGAGRPMQLEEEAAQEAATCGGMFVNVEYPLDRFLRFSRDGLDWGDQKESPYYFRGCSTSDIVGMTTKNVFLKVWYANKRNDRKAHHERRYHKRAFDAGIPVAFPVHNGIVETTHSDGTRYLVLATEYLDEDAIGTVEELLQFSISLLETVLKLHKEAGMLHGSLKPDNMRWNNGVVKMIDFERAQKISGATWQPGPSHFSAPEVSREEPCSRKSDAYSVGRTIQKYLRTLKKEQQVDGQNEICQILEETVQKLTIFDPESRWYLRRALSNIRKKTTFQKPLVDSSHGGDCSLVDGHTVDCTGTTHKLSDHQQDLERM